ncbi:hydroxyphenylacetyl-CoA thioesterase PaaI [Corynebacterium casei]|uniref:hydroxyphenylacetyl-CoA thioesterase PaaI n=2 Tax=Corynebacterium casei TaxID=160386 RepID=UPI001868816A|nr:hydroxyphenylacetyl-CoA thioesterase PaaI [Corynebacterium casei]
MHKILAPGVAEEEQFAHVRNMFADDLATAHLGITITHVSMGRCDGHFTITPEMCNGHLTAQGGFLYTFADSLFAGACNSPGEVAVAVHNSIHYMAPAFSGDEIHGTAEIKQHWGRNGIVDVQLTKDGKTIAEFRGTFRQLPGKPEARKSQ